MTEILQRKFVKPTSISNSLKCPICSDVFTQPTRMFCSHTLCLQCIKRCVKANNLCPLCRTKIDQKNMGPDLIAQNIIDQLEVFCPVEDCPWVGLNCSLDFHYQLQCTTKFKTNGQKSHMKNKVFNLDLLKDEQVEEKINQNVTKGSFQARLQARFKKDNPFSNIEAILRKEKKQNKDKKDQKKEVGLSDFLQQLFQ